MLVRVDRSLLWLRKVKRKGLESLSKAQNRLVRSLYGGRDASIQRLHTETGAAVVIIGAAWELNPKAV